MRLVNSVYDQKETGNMDANAASGVWVLANSGTRAFPADPATFKILTISSVRTNQIFILPLHTTERKN